VERKTIFSRSQSYGSKFIVCKKIIEFGGMKQRDSSGLGSVNRVMCFCFRPQSLVSGRLSVHS